MLVHPGLVATLLVIGALMAHVAAVRFLQGARYEYELEDLRSVTWAQAEARRARVVTERVHRPHPGARRIFGATVGDPFESRSAYDRLDDNRFDDGPRFDDGWPDDGPFDDRRFDDRRFDDRRFDHRRFDDRRFDHRREAPAA